MKKIATLLTLVLSLSFATLAPSLAHADEPETEPPTEAVVPSAEEIVTLKKGDPAPFDGTLFSTSAAARLLLDLEFKDEGCQVRVDRQLGLLRADLQLQLDIKDASLTTLNFKHTELMAIKNSQILFLEGQIKPVPWFKSGELTFAVGVVSGILVTVAAGYAMGQVAN